MLRTTVSENSINDLGWVTGFAQTGVNDPSFLFPLAHAVLWRNRKALDLGTLAGGSVSLGISVNNDGEVVGFSDNGVPDPFAAFFFPLTRKSAPSFGNAAHLRTSVPWAALALSRVLAATINVPESLWAAPTLTSRPIPALGSQPSTRSSGITASSPTWEISEAPLTSGSAPITAARSLEAPACPVISSPMPSAGAMAG